MKRLGELVELDVNATHVGIQLLAKRKLNKNSSLGTLEDGCKLGLVVEGAGMRGALVQES